MTYAKFWVFEHQGWLLAGLGFVFWVFANYWYLRPYIARMRRDNLPHSWSADLAAKTSKGGRKSIW